jgi:hypothetical protein
MSDHLDGWIDAYLDGELTVLQVRRVEAHLAQCTGCRDLLQQRKNLSTMLKELPSATGLKPEARFVAEVDLRLRERRISPGLPRQALHWSWQLVPLALLGGLAFVQTVMFLNRFTWALPGGMNLLLARSSALSFTLQAPGILDDFLGTIGVGNLLDWNWLTGLFAMFLIGLAYIGWLGSWWVSHRQLEANSEQ